MTELQVDPSHYCAEYHRRERYYSYVEQIMIAHELAPRSVVEIGIGAGFVSRELRASGIDVRTVDVDARLGPDIVATVDHLPLADGVCDLVFCCQVLEHLPFDKFDTCLRELGRVTRKYALVSLPNVDRAIRGEIARGLNPGRSSRFILSPPPLKPRPHRFNGQHYWEIGKLEYTAARVEQAMRDAGFAVLRSYRLYVNPYHHFFVLEKQPIENT